MFNNKKNQSGFTLVEMMITIGIIAILAAIAYPNYMQYIQRARMEAARAEMADNIRMMEQHYAKNRTMCENKDSNNLCTSMPKAIENAAADFYDTSIIADPMSTNSSSYIIISVPNAKNKYTNSTLQTRQLYLLYYSNGSGYVKCTQSGFEKVKTQNNPSDDSNGCSVV